MHKVVIYSEDDTYSGDNGQTVVVKITRTDGTMIEIIAFNPWLIINGVGYKTKYKPCEQLNRLGNNIE